MPNLLNDLDFDDYLSLGGTPWFDIEELEL